MSTKVLKYISVCVLVLAFAALGTGVAKATVTVNATTVSGDAALTLTGAATSVWSLSDGALSITASGVDDADDLTLTSTTAGDIILASGDDIAINGAGASAAITIGTAAVEHTITIGNTTTATGIVLTSGTGGIDMTSTAVSADAFDISAASLTTADLFDIDAAAITAGNFFNITVPATRTGGAVFLITDSSATGVATAPLIDVNVGSTSDTNVLDITFATAASSGDAIAITTGTNLAGNALQITTAGIRTAPVIFVDGVATDGGTDDHIIDINQSGLLNSNVIDITYSSAASDGKAIYLDMGTNVAGDALSIASASTTGDSIDITQTVARTSGSAIRIVDSADATASAATVQITAATITDVAAMAITTALQTTGNAVTIDGGASAYTSGTALEVTGSGVYATDADAGLLAVNATGIATDGYIASILANVATTIDAVLQISGNALTSGNGLVVAGTGTGLTGNLFSVTSASTGAATNGLARFNFSGAHTGNGLQVDDATLTGAAVQITASGILTGAGSALSITADAATTPGATAGQGVVRISADGLSTGTALDVTSTSLGLATGELANFEHIVSGTITAAKTGQLVDITSSRDHTAATAISDDYDALSITRTSINTDAGGTLNAAGSVLYIANIATQTAGTLADSANLVELVQDSDSSGDAINIDMNAALGAAALTVIDASGARTDAIIDINTTSTGSASDAAAIFQINTSGALVAEANVIDVNVSGIALSNVLDITFATDAATGDAIAITTGTNLAGNALQITTAGVRTAPVINIVGVGTDGGTDDHILFINQTGILDSNLIQLTFATNASTGEALSIAMDTNVAGRAIAITTAGTGVDGEGSAIDITHTGVLVAGADVVNITSSGAISSTSNVIGIDFSNGVAGSFGLYINATESGEAIKVDAGTVTFDETLLVSGLLTAGASISVTGSVTASTFVSADAYQVTNGTTVTATGALAKATLQAASYWQVNSSAGPNAAVDIDLGAAGESFDAGDVGRKLVFGLTTGTGILTVTQNDTLTVTTVQAGATANVDAAGDYIECTILSTTVVACASFAQ